MRWIYLSPHLDDVAFSCGGLVWEQTRSGTPVDVWTICAGDPPTGELSSYALELHERWETGPEAGNHRRQEDIESLQLLGANYRHLAVPDCIYRRNPTTGDFLYTSREALFGPLHPSEQDLVLSLTAKIERELEISSSTPGTAYTDMAAPMALGWHVDHQLTRSIAQAWKKGDPGRRLWYYADYPYVLDDLTALENLKNAGWQAAAFHLSPPAVDAWVRAIAAHESQISTFWTDLADLEGKLRGYIRQTEGFYLWKAPDD